MAELASVNLCYASSGGYSNSALSKIQSNIQCIVCVLFAKKIKLIETITVTIVVILAIGNLSIELI